MTRHAHRRGFTLMELMIALALAGLVVGGAMQMHAAFNKQAERQNQLAEMQQTLRVSMLIIERALRGAGSGLTNPRITMAGQGGSCAASTQYMYAFDWSDLNTFQDPITARQTNSAYIDTDPDWFTVISADNVGSVLASGDDGANATIVQTTPPPDLSNYNDGDLFEINFPAGCKCSYGTFTNVSCANLGTCMREISKGNAHGGSSGTKFLQHAPSQSARCFNPPPGQDKCSDALKNLSSTCPNSYATIRHFSGSATTFRIMQGGGVDVLNPGASAPPKLTMRTVPMGTAYDDATPANQWQVIAENVEDMQIAVIAGPPNPQSTAAGIDSTNRSGQVCTSVDSGLPPTGCDPAAIATVRVTLTVRSSSPMVGTLLGSAASGLNTQPPIGSEDEAQTTPNDGYLRRSATAEIEMRNITWSP